MRKLLPSISLALLLGAGCDTEPEADLESAVIDPLATDSFFMRNAEIREDLLNQLAIHDIEFWVNDDQSIGFYVKDTKEVDRLANEAIGVYISLQ